MDLAAIEAKARKAIAPLVAAEAGAAFWGVRTEAGRSLPPYYLVYFLLVKLLGFKDLGQFEKVAFSIPIEINGTVLMVEHRKFGLGIFSKGPAADEVASEQAAKRIRAGVRAAQAYFDSLADAAAKATALNVINNAPELFERLQYFTNKYAAKSEEAEERRF